MAGDLAEDFPAAVDSADLAEDFPAAAVHPEDFNILELSALSTQ